MFNPFGTIVTIATQIRDTISFLSNPNAATDALWDDVTAPRDAAERLADDEAEEEVAEPDNGAFREQIAPGSMKATLGLGIPLADCGLMSVVDRDGVLRTEPFDADPAGNPFDRLVAVFEDIRNQIDHVLASVAPAHSPADAAAERPATDPHDGAGHQTSAAAVRRDALGPHETREQFPPAECTCNYPEINRLLDLGHEPRCPHYLKK